MDKDNPRVQDVLQKTRGYPRRRMGLIYDMCKAKAVCEGVDNLDGANMEDMDEAERELKSGGCGRYQPNYKRTGIEVHAEWRKNVNDDMQVGALKRRFL